MSNLIKASLAPDRYLKFDQLLIEYPSISGFAKWVYAYIASRPPEWQIYASEIAKRCTEGIEKVKSALKELQAHGLLQIELERDRKSNRFTGRLWRLFGFSKPARQADPVRKRLCRLTAPQPTGNPALIKSNLPKPKDLNLSLEKPKTKSSMLAKIQARCAALSKAPVPEWVTEKREIEKSFQKALQCSMEARAEAAKAQHAKYYSLEPHKVIPELAREFLKNPKPELDAKNIQALSDWYVKCGPSSLSRVVEAFARAGANGAVSAKYVLNGLAL